MFIPNWLNLLLLLGTFVVALVQYRRWPGGRHGPFNRRFLLPTACVALMVGTIAFNRSSPWVSLGLFAGILLCMAAVVCLHFEISLKRPRRRAA